MLRSRATTNTTFVLKSDSQASGKLRGHCTCDVSIPGSLTESASDPASPQLRGRTGVPALPWPTRLRAGAQAARTPGPGSRCTRPESLLIDYPQRQHRCPSELQALSARVFQRHLHGKYTSAEHHLPVWSREGPLGTSRPSLPVACSWSGEERRAHSPRLQDQPPQGSVMSATGVSCCSGVQVSSGGEFGPGRTHTGSAGLHGGRAGGGCPRLGQQALLHWGFSPAGHQDLLTPGWAGLRESERELQGHRRPRALSWHTATSAASRWPEQAQGWGKRALPLDGWSHGEERGRRETFCIYLPSTPLGWPGTCSHQGVCAGALAASLGSWPVQGGG